MGLGRLNNNLMDILQLHILYLLDFVEDLKILNNICYKKIKSFLI